MTAPQPLRVMVLDAWDEVQMEVPPTAKVADVKQQALERCRVTRAPASYVMKHRGWEVPEGATLAEAGIGPHSAVIVLPRRRQPVR